MAVNYQAVFRRYEMKYLLTDAQLNAVLAAMEPYMVPDKYGLTTIRNIYFDTENYQLIRHSIEKPLYKEKLRLRSYGTPTGSDPVFVELKKKFDGVVYKRRVSMPMDEALGWICDRKPHPSPCQITREIDYFTDFYGSLRPAVFLSYDRIAYYAKDGSDFRVTFDRNICCRQEDLRLDGNIAGAPILPPGKTMMEICALFLAMASGLIVGMGYLMFGLVFVLVMGAAFLLYTKLGLGGKQALIPPQLLQVKKKFPEACFREFLFKYQSLCQ